MKSLANLSTFFFALLTSIAILSFTSEKLVAAPLTEEMLVEWLQTPIENKKHTIVIGSQELPWGTPAILWDNSPTNIVGLAPEHTWRFADYKKDDNRYLSNFYPHPIIVDGLPYKTSEHYYQAIKFPIGSQIYLDVINASTPLESKQVAWANAATQHVGDDQMMSQRMKKVLWVKFTNAEGHPNELGLRLMATGDMLIVEGNRRITPEGKNMSDQRWGMEFDFSKMPESVSMTGQNLLGNVLMELRAILQTANQ